MIILFLVMTHLVTVFFLSLGIASIIPEFAFSVKVHVAPTPLGYESINTLSSCSKPRVYVDVPSSTSDGAGTGHVHREEPGDAARPEPHEVFLHTILDVNTHAVICARREALPQEPTYAERITLQKIRSKVHKLHLEEVQVRSITDPEKHQRALRQFCLDYRTEIDWVEEKAVEYRSIYRGNRLVWETLSGVINGLSETRRGRCVPFMADASDGGYERG
ncbi:hypothetical protein EV360DRAFT_73168 [Lentinula raphanica]|nr:hypothetical protein EV360DRAFT_73168 [Lentinula raphanica]